MSEADHIEDQIPGLAESVYRITSPPDPDYNCVAWALRDSGRWWAPAAGDENHWPDDLQVWPSLEAFIELFAREGYSVCADGSVEAGIEKVAIFVYPSGEPTHMARQLPSGSWTSKLGTGVDIEHDDVGAVACGLLGEVKVFMSRSSPGPPPEGPQIIVPSSD